MLADETDIHPSDDKLIKQTVPETKQLLNLEIFGCLINNILIFGIIQHNNGDVKDVFYDVFLVKIRRKKSLEIISN